MRNSEQSRSANTSQADIEKTGEMQINENLDIINESLDNQISELLSSIREEEENKETDDNEADPEPEIASVETEFDNKSVEVISETSEEAEVQIVNKEEILKTEEKETVKATPTRASARIATSTPGPIRTRRASKRSQN